TERLHAHRYRRWRTQRNYPNSDRDPRRDSLQDVMPATIQLRNVRTHCEYRIGLRYFLSVGWLLSASGPLFHHCVAATIGRYSVRLYAPRRRDGHVCIRGSASTRAATRDGVRRGTLPQNSTILERMDRQFQIQGPLAGDGQPFGIDVEVADQPGARIADCSPDIFAPRRNWRSAQLGLSLHLVAR